MNPFDPTPPGGDAHRLDRLLVWVATAGALGCSVLIFVLSNAQQPEPMAEPADTALPVVASATITTTEPTTTTTPPATTTTTAPPTTTTTRPKTTAKPTTTTRTTTTVRTTTAPPTTSPRCQVSAWQRNTAYSGGSVVSYGGQLWVAKWWNYNAVPGANAEGVWLPARSCP